MEQSNEFGITLKNRFQALEKLIDEETVKEKRKATNSVTSSCQQVLGQKKYTHKDWITTETLEMIERLRSTVAPTLRKSEHR